MEVKLRGGLSPLSPTKQAKRGEKVLLKKILSTFLILGAISLYFGGDASAKTLTSPNLGETIVIGKDEVIEGPYLNAGDNVTISGTINGDTYIGGGVITIDGTINGDLLIGGGVVTIKGKVSDDVRAVGGMVTIDGKVGKNVTAFGGTITFGSDADIDGSVITGGGTFAHLGNIDGKALIYSGETTLAGRIGGNVETTAEKVTVLKTALLDGNLVYTSDKEASVSAEAKITGTVQQTLAGKAWQKVGSRVQSGLFPARFGVNLLSYLSLLLLGLVLLKLAPRQVAAVSKLIGEQPWRSLGLGLLGLVLTPLVIVVLTISVIGLPLALLAGGGYVLMIGLSSLFTGFFVGQKVFDLANLKENRYAMLAIGLLLLQLILALPIVGSFVGFLSLLAAMGAMLTLGREALRKLE